MKEEVNSDSFSINSQDIYKEAFRVEQLSIDSDDVLRVKQLTKSFKSRPGRPDVLAVDGISFGIKRSEVRYL